MNSAAPAHARISIIGAGPGGLTCARILQRHGIAVTVYDRDPGPDARNQGGTLDLHADNGQIALREAGLLDEFFRLARPEGQEMRQLDPAGTMPAHQSRRPTTSSSPRSTAASCATCCSTPCDPGTVRWGHALDTVSGPADGPRQLHFADGTTVETDLVIGADGAFSRVRPAVSPAVPRYTGVSFLEARFDDVEQPAPRHRRTGRPGRRPRRRRRPRRCSPSATAAATSASTSSSGSRSTGSAAAA